MDTDDGRLIEIRDLLVEMRDMQREQMGHYQRFAGISVERQAAAMRIQRVALVTVAVLVVLVVLVAILFAVGALIR